MSKFDAQFAGRLDGQTVQGSEEATEAALVGEITQFSISTVCDKRELFWPRRVINFRVTEVLRILRQYFGGGSRPRVRQATKLP